MRLVHCQLFVRQTTEVNTLRLILVIVAIRNGITDRHIQALIGSMQSISYMLVHTVCTQLLQLTVIASWYHTVFT